MVMKKVLPILSSLLLLPLLLSNAPAPGPFQEEAEHTLTLTEDGLYYLRNDSKDQAIFSIDYSIDHKEMEPIPGFEGLSMTSELQTGYFILPGEEVLLPTNFAGRWAPVKDIELEARGILLDDLSFEKQEITIDIKTTEGKSILSLNGDFMNPSERHITYKVGVYAPTEKGNFYCLADETIAKEGKSAIALEAEIPDGLSEEDFSPILVYDNFYYSEHYGNQDTDYGPDEETPKESNILPILGYTALGILLAVLLVSLVILVPRKRKKDS